MDDCLSLKEFAAACSSAERQLSNLKNLGTKQLIRVKQLLKCLCSLAKLSHNYGAFYPSSQRKTKRKLQQILQRDLWNDRFVRMVCSFYWYSLKDPGLEFAQSLENYVKDCCERFNCTYPVHKAVFERDLVTLSHLCTGEDKYWIYVDLEMPDLLGNTPLMLAIKLDFLEEAIVLLDFGADPKYTPDPTEPTPYEHAVATKNKGLLTRMLAAINRQKNAMWEIHREELAKMLSEMPDFTLKIGWQCESNFIPFLRKFAPSDDYLIYKKGQDFRVDLSLIGVSKLKSVRGKISLLFKDNELMLVDHDKSRIKNLMAEPSNEKLEAEADVILKSKRFSKAYQPTSFSFLQARDWRGNAVVSTIGSWNATKFNASCQILLQYTKKPVFLDAHLQTLRSFEEYLEYASAKDHSASNSIITLSPRDSKNLTKNLKATLWLSSEFPMHIKNLLPIVEILSTVSKKAKTLKELLEAEEFPKTIGFPVKIVFPVFWTVKAVATFTDFEQGFVHPSLFDYSLKTEEADLDLYNEDELFSRLTESEGPSDIVYSEESTAKVHEEFDEESDNEEDLARAHEVFMTLSSSNSSDEEFSEIYEESSINSCCKEDPLDYTALSALSAFTACRSNATTQPPSSQRGFLQLDAEFVLSRLKECGQRADMGLDVDVDM
mmetsp:Transcript_7678/g.14492  ORF Transcript_7678/g.14492 Transcript_7678/m.14492 type:complete len:661 (+) Transcript_7678:6320-8302(+)